MESLICSLPQGGKARLLLPSPLGLFASAGASFANTRKALDSLSKALVLLAGIAA